MSNIKSAFFGAMLLFCISSCNSNLKSSKLDSSSTDSASQFPQRQLCFQRLEGTANQDTSFITLIINEDQVTGTLNHIPHEKDSRKGTISGNIKDDEIKAVWLYMQEGMNDTLAVEFKLGKEILMQKSYGIDSKTGRQILTDSSTYSIKYTKIACP